MSQNLAWCRSVSWVTLFVRLVLVGILAALDCGVAQISLCREPDGPGIRVKNACTSQLDQMGPFDTTIGVPQPLDLTIPPEQPQRRGIDSQLVTAQQLSHAVPKKAQKEEESAEKAFQRHRLGEAIGHFKTAVQIDPWFVRARNNLAILYIWTEHPDLAVEELDEAIRLDPHFPPLFTNLAISYIVAAKFPDAERAARSALDLSRTQNLPRYLLATALYYQKKFTDETLRCAQETSGEYPLSHLFAARVLMEKREFQAAREEIQRYLTGSGRLELYVPSATSWLDYISANEPKRDAMPPENTVTAK